MSAQQQLNDARLQLRQAQTRLAGTVITAPVAGKVLSVGGTIGATTQAGSAFIVLAGTADVAVRAGFTEAEVASLAAGQSARVTLPDRQSVPLTGRVIQIDPAGTVSNRLVTYAALIAFDQVPDGLLYGQSATVAVVTNSAVEVLYVPSTAITDLDGSRGTVVVRTNNQDVRRTVEIGLRGDTTTEIRDGLTEGEVVITGGGS
jgi:RND family efflux transporter MFP subunit